MRTKYKRRASLAAWAVVAIFACQTATAVKPLDVRRAVGKASDAAEFAGHVEDGIKISQTVGRVQNIAEGGTAAELAIDGTQASKVAERGKDAVESVSAGTSVGAEVAKEAAAEVSQAVFAEVIEDEIQDQLLGQGRKAIRKAIRP